MMRHIGPLALSLLVLHGCGSADGSSQQQNDITEGTAVEHPHVGYLTQGGHFCTGTVISRFHVLTAAHCLAEHGEPVREQMIDFYLGGKEFPAHFSAVVLHPDYARNQGLDLDQPDALIEGDFAVIGFELQLSESYASLSDAPPALHERIEMWGFGMTDLEDRRSLGASHRARSEVQESYDSYFLYYGDDPDFGMVAPGDSGGPSFNSRGELIGVHSQLMTEDFFFSYDGTEPRTEPGGAGLDMRIDAVRPWIDGLIADGTP